MMRRTLLGTLVLAAALLATSCASSSSSASTSPTPSPSPSPVHIASVDPCTLVTAADASTALGTPVVNLASAGGVAIPNECIYGMSGKDVGMVVFAQVYSDASAADAVQPDQIAAALGGQVGVGTSKVVTGIGDKAFEYTASTEQGGGIAIFVFKANVVIMIVMSPSQDSNAIELVARTAVGRLTS